MKMEEALVYEGESTYSAPRTAIPLAVHWKPIYSTFAVLIAYDDTQLLDTVSWRVWCINLNLNINYPIFMCKPEWFLSMVERPIPAQRPQGYTGPDCERFAVFVRPPDRYL